MGLETGTYISDLVDTNPTSGDPKSQGDDQIRLVKKILKITFPAFTGPMPIAHDQIASKDYVNQTAYSAALPAQALGFLRSTGAAASFGTTHAGYAQNEVKGADIASAATINLTTATGNLVHVTGTTTITAITIPAGAERELVFDGALTLTHSAALLLPGAANIATQVGDRATVRGDSAGAIVTHYQRADGLAVTPHPQTMTLLGQATIGAAVANIDFLNLFSSGFDRIVIESEGLQPSATDNLYMRLAVAGALDTASNYLGPFADNATGAGTAFFSLTPGGVLAGAANAFTSTIDLRNVNSAAQAKSLGLRGTATNVMIVREGRYVGAAVSGFRLYWSGGANFAAGTVRVYGIRNS